MKIFARERLSMALAIFGKSSSPRKPLRNLNESILVTLDSKRSTSCSLLISSEKTPTDFPSRTAAYSAMFSASDVLPTEGRAASTMKSDA